MKFHESNPRKRASMQRKAADEMRKKEAWKKYEMNIRRAKSGYSDLDLYDET